jgi:hypothetical protein
MSIVLRLSSPCSGDLKIALMIGLNHIAASLYLALRQMGTFHHDPGIH